MNDFEFLKALKDPSRWHEPNFRTKTDEYRKYLLGYFRAKAPADDVQDLAQVAFIRMIKYGHTCNIALKPWVRTVAGSVLAKYYEERAQKVDWQISDGGEEALDDVKDELNAQRCRNCLVKLLTNYEQKYPKQVQAISDIMNDVPLEESRKNSGRTYNAEKEYRRTSIIKLKPMLRGCAEDCGRTSDER